MLSEKAIAEIRALQARYPVARSALGPALYVAQGEVGWLPPGVMAEVAGLFGLDPTSGPSSLLYQFWRLRPH